MSKDINWRYEIKYLLDAQQWDKILHIIQIHPAGFTTLFPDRYVNNIYFDTPDFEMCRDNLSGIADRKKYRLRWYGQGDINEAILEEKIKSNSLGYKKSIPYKGAAIHLSAITDWLNNKHLKCGQLIPTLYNQYLRSYYLSHDGLFRITIDRFISYKTINHFDKSLDLPTVKDNRIVVELKYDKSSEDQLKDISAYLSLHPSKHSKYVTGVLALYG